jgi:hypothetical protein
LLNKEKIDADETFAEKDQVGDNVGNASYVPDDRMLTKENTMI